MMIYIGISYHLYVSGDKMSAIAEIEHKLTRIIHDDDKAQLEEVMTRMGICPSSRLFEACAGSLAPNCFIYLFSIRDSVTVKRDGDFLRLCIKQAQQGCNYDGRALWQNSHKRNAPSAPPAKYSLPWEFCVPETCFITALSAGLKMNDRKKALAFVKMLIMMRVPCGDNLYFTINSIDSIQGYVSLFHKYIY